MINKCNIILGYYTYKYFVFKISHGLFFSYSIRKSKDKGESSENFLFGWYGMLSRLDRCLKLTLYLIETFANLWRLLCCTHPIIISLVQAGLMGSQLQFNRSILYTELSIAGDSLQERQLLWDWFAVPLGPHLINGKHALTRSPVPSRQ